MGFLSGFSGTTVGGAVANAMIRKLKPAAAQEQPAMQTQNPMSATATLGEQNNNALQKKRAAIINGMGGMASARSASATLSGGLI